MADDYRGRKLSWREIDRLKDQSGFSRIRRKYSNPKAKERYLKELNKLFKGKEEEKEKALEELKKAHGTKGFKKAVKKYLSNYGVPNDPWVILLMLDVEDKNLLLELLSAVKDRIEIFKNGAKKQLISRLKALALSSSDEIVGYRAEKLLKELK